jgi:hypothetical protein
MVLDIISETKDPPKPIRLANASSMPMFNPLLVKKRSIPSMLALIDSTSITAMLVNKKRTTRFI